MTLHVTTIIATRGRPELLRSALRSIFAQDHPGPIEVIVVFDHIDIDDLGDVGIPEGRTLVTVENRHAQGLAGGRNTGIDLASGDVVCFCDDDDSWETSKLRHQLDLLARRPDASIIATGIRIESEGGSTIRIPPTEVTFDDLLRSRVTELHPSGFLAPTKLLRQLAGIDEDIPSSYGEDYDLLLRAAKCGPIVSVTEPLVVVNWNRPSFFTLRWQGIAEGLEYILVKHPEFERSPKGSARVESQIAFARAAMGERSVARRWARTAIRHDWLQVRAYAALAVSLRLVSPGRLVSMANRRGHGV